MPSYDVLALFVAAVVLYAVAPGPAVFYIVTRSLSQGRRVGITSSLAVASGNLAHVAAAVAGLSALLASSAAAFAVVKYLGAAYLIYLGVRTLLRRGGDEPEPRGSTTRLPRVYRQGVVVALLNPKTAVFFLAFLPQFVDPSRASAAVQIAVLGMVLVTVTAISDCCYALVSGTAGDWMRRRRGFRRGGQLVSGGAYIALGIAAALTGERPAKAA